MLLPPIGNRQRGSAAQLCRRGHVFPGQAVRDETRVENDRRRTWQRANDRSGAGGWRQGRKRRRIDRTVELSGRDAHQKRLFENGPSDRGRWNPIERK